MQTSSSHLDPHDSATVALAPENRDASTLANGLSETQDTNVRVSLRALLTSFLKVGATGFGGGMAIIALMEDELVSKHRALSSDEFVAGVGLSQFLGAFPVNTALFVGYRLYGLAGALLSASMFLLPSVTLVTLLSVLYFHFHALPALGSVFRGVNAVVIALIISAAWSLGRRVVHSARELIIGAAALIAGVLHVHPIVILLVAAVLGFLFAKELSDGIEPTKEPPGVSASVGSFIPLLGKLSSLTATFLKVGAFFFGGGFALIPLLQAVIVTQHRWLTTKEFLDGIAISSLTPGPIAVIATFVGYRQAGVLGALTSTIALFLPGTVLMVWISHSYGQFRHSQTLLRILSGVNPATIGLVLSAGFSLARGSLTSWAGLIFSLTCLVLLVRLKWPPPVVLGLGAIIGYLRVI